MPSEAAISNKLRDVVVAIHKTGKTEELTVKRVRARAEKELGLDEGFFKTNSSWKQKSQDAIVEAVVSSHGSSSATPTDSSFNRTSTVTMNLHRRNPLRSLKSHPQRRRTQQQTTALAE